MSTFRDGPVVERFATFECGDDTCIGIVASNADVASRADIGVVIVVGGPQYRVGSHRQFVTLARALAASGVPALRFDYRGMVSSAIGLFPLSPADGNALYSLMTSYSTLRAAKGPLWALLMLPMFAATGPQWRSRMSAGIVAGLGALIGVIAWQRYAFAGLFDTTTDYRVEGTFPELRVGGGDVHAYLVMAAPFVVAWAMARIAVWRFVAACALLVLVSYAVAVTFTRGGYVGFAAALAVLAIFAALRAVNGGALQKGIAVALVTMIAAAAVVLPLMSGSFMRARVADSGAEAGVRFNHWTRAIDMMDATPRALLFGMTM